MEILVDIDPQNSHLTLELGSFEDLVFLVDLLNRSIKNADYSLEQMPGERGVFLFEEVRDGDAYCGMVTKKGKAAIAHTPAVHELVLGAYERYKDLYGDPMA